MSAAGPLLDKAAVGAASGFGVKPAVDEGTRGATGAGGRIAAEEPEVDTLARGVVILLKKESMFF